MQTQWESILRCPIDRQPLTWDGAHYHCESCGFTALPVDLNERTVPDFRAQDRPQTVNMSFQLPTVPLQRESVVREMFHAVSQDFPHYSRQEVRQQFGTKLDKGIQYYCQQLLQTRGPDVPILDLGCGNGGNRRYLQSLGFTQVVTVDWQAVGADLLVDAHRLPFDDGVFGMVISTAVLEHLYNPFIAMHEIARVLDDQGVFTGGASFWEAWHGSSYFHVTPDGWNAILSQNEMQLEDLWSGWGIIPAALSHVLTPGMLRQVGYGLQALVEGVYRLALGQAGVRKLRLRASGSYTVFARKRGNDKPA